MRKGVVDRKLGRRENTSFFPKYKLQTYKKYWSCSVTAVCSWSADEARQGHFKAFCPSQSPSTKKISSQTHELNAKARLYFTGRSSHARFCCFVQCSDLIHCGVFQTVNFHEVSQQELILLHKSNSKLPNRSRKSLLIISTVCTKQDSPKTSI